MANTPPEKEAAAPVLKKNPLAQGITSLLNAPQQTIVQKSSTFSGPLPPPDALERYERIHTGFADRIIAMAEEEGRHRRAQEQRQLESDIEARTFLMETDRATIQGGFAIQKRGQWLAYLIGTTAIVAGAILGYYGKELSGGVIGGGGVIGLVWVFIAGHRSTEPPAPPTGQDIARHSAADANPDNSG